jgi:glyoxylase-like metal-dependent hydrolase (beta-lactamase superfamily II)
VNLVFEQLRTGGDRNFGYLVGDRAAGVAVAVDPSYDPDRFKERADAQGLAITHVLNTHGHPDHTNGNARLVEITGAVLAAHPASPGGCDLALDEGSTLAVGSYAMRVFHVPGHCPDHLLFFLPGPKVAITGDHLFVGKIGGTATEAAARDEWESFRRVLPQLPDETSVWPGHDYGCRAASTIALEKAYNPFLLAADFDAFLALKRDWATFKAENGLA